MATMHRARRAFEWATDISQQLTKVGVYAGPAVVMNWPKPQQRRAIAWAQKERLICTGPYRKNPMPVFLSTYTDPPEAR